MSQIFIWRESRHQSCHYILCDECPGKGQTTHTTLAAFSTHAMAPQILLLRQTKQAEENFWKAGHFDTVEARKGTTKAADLPCPVVQRLTACSNWEGG